MPVVRSWKFATRKTNLELYAAGLPRSGVAIAVAAYVKLIATLASCAIKSSVQFASPSTFNKRTLKSPSRTAAKFAENSLNPHTPTSLGQPTSRHTQSRGALTMIIEKAFGMTEEETAIRDQFLETWKRGMEVVYSTFPNVNPMAPFNAASNLLVETIGELCKDSADVRDACLKDLEFTLRRIIDEKSRQASRK
jgi:hypothetical protein